MKTPNDVKPTAAPLPTRDPKDMWTRYRVSWSFFTNLCGQTPADPEIIKAWIAARKPRVQPAGGRSADEINEEVLASLERGEGMAPTEDDSLLVFQADPDPEGRRGLVFRASTIRAHIKDCARVISSQYLGKIEKERPFSTKVINGVYPDPAHYWVPILRPDGTPVTKPDGETEHPIQIRGSQGPRSALKHFEHIEPPSRMDFQLMILGESVRESDLHHLFTYGGLHGYAGERGNGEGKYTYTLERLSPPARRARSADGGATSTETGAGA